MGRLDDELEGREGTTLFEDSLAAEAEPANRSQGPGEFKEKVAAEKEKAGGGLTGAARALLHHADRELAGEYERREDPTAPRSEHAVAEEQQPGGGAPGR